MVADIRAPATERVGNRPSQHLNHRATSRLYPYFEMIGSTFKLSQRHR